MTSWILVIGDGFDGNWERAVDYQLWDLKKRASIKRGDDVFFWQASNVGFKGWARAASDAADGSLQPRPWIAKDTAQYVQRFYFEVVSEMPVAGSWGMFFKNTSVKAGPNTAPLAISNPDDEAYLRGLFLTKIDVTQVPFEVEVALEQDAGFLSDDDRRRMRNQVLSVREGQPAFRASLIDAYQGRCAVSGTPILRVLQAAHIAPYRGPHSNDVTNGLLLRSDIHTLFDARHLAVTADFRIKVDPGLRESHYWQFDGSPLRTPANIDCLPNDEALRQHFESCVWTK
ncbi:HNH endonuclease [Rhodococcus sp. (in: high G+C Gram-positive bacteria)]|uniref:HNH endonuclease n=1 Tax=Rhodococcus sp. TaxID=1831 RepID=UPI003B8A8324